MVLKVVVVETVVGQDFFVFVTAYVGLHISSYLSGDIA